MRTRPARKCGQQLCHEDTKDVFEHLEQEPAHCPREHRLHHRAQKDGGGGRGERGSNLPRHRHNYPQRYDSGRGAGAIWSMWRCAYRDLHRPPGRGHEDGPVPPGLHHLRAQSESSGG